MMPRCFACFWIEAKEAVPPFLCEDLLLCVEGLRWDFFREALGECLAAPPRFLCDFLLLPDLLLLDFLRAPPVVRDAVMLVYVWRET